MARISFRQGIINYPRNEIDGSQTFLEVGDGQDVNLVVNTGTSSDPVLITFVHGKADYLYTELVNINSAWSNFSSAQIQYLYWDMDTITGVVTRGQTDLLPIISSRQPAKNRRVQGQMWFNTRRNIWFEYSGEVWIQVIRVFAAKYNVGNSFESLSVTPNESFGGTQVDIMLGDRFSKNVGSLVFNSDGLAIKSGKDDQFFTTEDTFLTGAPTGASNKIANRIINGRAVEPIAAFHVVEFKNYNEIVLAKPTTQGERIFGIVDIDLDVGESATLTLEGLIYNEQWDWEAAGATVNNPIYISNTGEIILTKSASTRAPVGIVIGKKQIYFAPRLFPQLTVESMVNGNALSAAQLSQITNNSESISTINGNLSIVSSSISTLNNQVDSATQDIIGIQTTLDNKLNISGGTLTGPLILDGPPTTNFHAVNREYVTSTFRGIQLNINLNGWTVFGAEFRYQIPAAIHGLPLNTLYDVILFNDSGQRISTSYSVNESSGLITLITSGEPFSGKIRIR